MRIVAILQARMNSTRLPGKVLLPLAGKSMLQNIVERVRRCRLLDYVVVAYPLRDNEAFKFLFTDFKGTDGVSLGAYASQDDEDDLIARYLSASRAYSPDLIVRIPCDNPCVDPDYIDRCIEKYMAWPTVFESNAGWAEVGDSIVDGVGCEVFSVSRLKWLDEQTVGRPRYREHPHLLFHEHAGKSATHAEMRKTIRLDVNTQADYDFIKDIFDHFGHNHFTTQDVLSYLSTKEVSHAPQSS